MIVVLLVGLSLVAAGCGGGDDDDAASSDDAEAAATSEDSDDDSGADASDDVAAAALFTSTDCVRAVQAFSAAVSAVGLAMSGQTEEIEKTTREMDEFAKKAPREIRDEIETLRDAYGEYAQVIEDSGWDPAKGETPPQSVIDALNEASAALESDEVRGAQERLDAWFASECGQ
jgi:hypothetical protein